MAEERKAVARMMEVMGRAYILMMAGQFLVLWRGFTVQERVSNVESEIFVSNKGETLGLMLKKEDRPRDLSAYL